MDTRGTTLWMEEVEQCMEQLPRATQGAVADDCMDGGGRAMHGAIAESNAGAVAEQTKQLTILFGDYHERCTG